MTNQTRTEPLDLDAAWEALIADLRALNVDPRSTRYVTETHRPLIEAAIRSAEAREAARLRSALEAICFDDLRPDFEDGQDIVLRWVGNKADWERARAALVKP